MSAMVKINPGDEIEVDRAKLTESAVLVRREGVWIELRPEEATRELTIAIARLELERGDVLVVKAEHPNPQRSGIIHEMLSRIVPPGIRILQITPDVELSVLTKAEIDERAQTVEV